MTDETPMADVTPEPKTLGEQLQAATSAYKFMPVARNDRETWGKRFFDTLRHAEPEVIREAVLKKDPKIWTGICFRYDIFQWPFYRALQSQLPLEKIKAFAPPVSQDFWKDMTRSYWRSTKAHSAYVKNFDQHLLRLAFVHPDVQVFRFFVNEWLSPSYKSYVSYFFQNVADADNIKINDNWVQQALSNILNLSSDKEKLAMAKQVIHIGGADFKRIWCDFLKDQPVNQFRLGLFPDTNRKVYLAKAEDVFYELLQQGNGGFQAELVGLLMAGEEVHRQQGTVSYKDRLNAALCPRNSGVGNNTFVYKKMPDNVKDLSDEVIRWVKKQELLLSLGLASDANDWCMRQVNYELPEKSSGFGVWLSAGRTPVLRFILGHGLLNSGLPEYVRNFLSWIGNAKLLHTALGEHLQRANAKTIADESLKLLYAYPQYWTAWRDGEGNNLLHSINFDGLFNQKVTGISNVEPAAVEKWLLKEANPEFKERIMCLLFTPNAAGISPLDNLHAELATNYVPRPPSGGAVPASAPLGSRNEISDAVRHIYETWLAQVMAQSFKYQRDQLVVSESASLPKTATKIRPRL